MPTNYCPSEYLTSEVMEDIYDDGHGNTLTFEPLPEEQLEFDYLDSLLKRTESDQGWTEVHFGQFENECDRGIVERAVIQHALQNTPDFLSVWRLLGNEATVDYVKYLEKKYTMRLENIEVAARLFDLTYEFWGLFSADTTTERGRERIESKLDRIVELARSLGNHVVHGTHQIQNPELIGKIQEIQTLKASGPEHYEGKGVYIGILGGYRDWGKEKSTINLKVPLEDTLPIITDREYPQAMAVVLCDELAIHQRMEAKAEPGGTIEWSNDEYFDENENLPEDVVNWKIEKIKEQLDCDSVFTYEDEEGSTVYVVDTDLPPIIWASLAKALKISRLLPSSSFEKMHGLENDL